MNDTTAHVTDEGDTKFCFSLEIPFSEESLLLRAANEDIMTKWINLITTASQDSKKHSSTCKKLHTPETRRSLFSKR